MLKLSSSRGIRIDVPVLSVSWSFEDHSVIIQALRKDLSSTRPVILEESLVGSPLVQIVWQRLQYLAPQGVRTLISIGTVLCVTDTVAPVAVRATRGPFSSGICSAAPPKLEDMRDSNPTPIDVRADPESRNTRAMKDPTDPGKERSARKHSAL